MDFQNNYKKYLDSMNQNENEGMTELEMQELQEAIDKSKETASAERQSAEIQKTFERGSVSPNASEKPTKEKSFTPRQWSKQHRAASDILDKELFSSPKDFKISFQDLPEANHKSLNIVNHTPKFDLPVTTNLSCQKYSIQERAKTLYNYYTKIDKIRGKIGRKSIYRAPYPKEILSSNKCSLSLCKNEDNNGNFDDFFADSSPTTNVYVSRSGRQVKRKVYTEDPEIDDDFTQTIKKNKHDNSEHDNSDLKITLDNPFIPVESPKLLTKTRKDLQRQISLSTKKSTNRSEELFDRLTLDSEKRKQQQEEIDNFEKTLPNLSDEEQIIESSQNHAEENFVKRRVVPLIPTKRGSRARKPIQEDKGKKNSPPGSPVLGGSPLLRNTENKSRGKARSQKPKESEIQTECPICNQRFPEAEIANHAAVCGLEDTLEPTVKTSKNVEKTIRCDLCEKVFNMNSNFEDHVKKCIASQITDM